jgi:hypothetical protein
VKAAVILTKCKNDHALFGIRTEQREDGGWYATWAFKVSEQTAEREKFGDTKISGNIYITTEYPSCPYCGATTTPDASGCCEYCGSAIGG